MNALPGRSQGLLLTEKYEVGRLHWHIHQLGTLRLGVRIPSENARYGATGYGSPALFTPRKIGIWTFLCTVYDRKGGTLRHYLNGKEVSPLSFLISHCKSGPGISAIGFPNQSDFARFEILSAGLMN